MKSGERLIVKIGSESLKNFSNSTKVSKIVEAIAQKMQDGVKVLLVTSGAVQFGREKYNRTIENKQVLAALGWHPLLNAYSEKFRPHGVSVAGFLVTHADIEDVETRAKTFQETIEATWQQGFLPIVNENDPISTEEMLKVGRGADNDKNAFLLARIFRARQLILITNTNGAYSDPTNPSTRITSIQSDFLTSYQISQICAGKSDAGTGGMESKLSIGYEAGELGIDTHIGNGIDSGVHDISSGGTNIWSIHQYPNFQI